MSGLREKNIMFLAARGGEGGLRRVINRNKNPFARLRKSCSTVAIKAWAGASSSFSLGDQTTPIFPNGKGRAIKFRSKKVFSSLAMLPKKLDPGQGERLKKKRKKKPFVRSLEEERAHRPHGIPPQFPLFKKRFPTFPPFPDPEN